MTKYFQKIPDGFALFETLAILLVIMGAGYAGYYVSQKHNTEARDKISSTSSLRQAVFRNTSSSSSASKYLVITEWSVKMPLSSDFTDYAYSISGNRASLYTRYLKSLSQCNDYGNTYNVKYITRYAGNDSNNFYEPAGDTTVASIYDNKSSEDASYGTDLTGTLKKVGNYYYYLSGNQSSGCDNPVTGQEYPQADRAISEYEAGFKSLTANN